MEDKTWKLIENFNFDGDFLVEQAAETDPTFLHPDFSGNIRVTGMTYSHKNNPNFKLEVQQFNISAGEVVAIVGSSGAGKSTFADLILGILTPDMGSIEISGFAPKVVFTKFPGSVAYIPQKVFIADASVKENVSLGYNQANVDDRVIFELLKTVHLESWVNALDNGIHTNVGESGHTLSGGQQQRLGIARALFTQPGLIVMDEATSALDAQTEKDISESINALKGKVTLLIIAHRLSTVRDANKVVLFESGKIVSQGSFEEVRSESPSFDKQAKLMGL